MAFDASDPRSGPVVPGKSRSFFGFGLGCMGLLLLLALLGGHVHASPLGLALLFVAAGAMGLLWRWSVVRYARRARDRGVWRGYGAGVDAGYREGYEDGRRDGGR